MCQFRPSRLLRLPVLSVRPSVSCAATSFAGLSCSIVGSVRFVRSRSICPSVPVLSSLSVHPTRSLVRSTRPVRSEYYKNNSSGRSWNYKLVAPYFPHKYPYPNNPCDFQLLQRRFYGQTYELNLLNKLYVTHHLLVSEHTSMVVHTSLQSTTLRATRLNVVVFVIEERGLNVYCPRNTCEHGTRRLPTNPS